LNWRTPVTLLVLLGVLLGGAYYGWQTIVNPGDDTKTEKPTTKKPAECRKKVTIQKGSQVQAADVRINVYNAGIRSGLAGDTLASLVEKGFQQGIADNAPESLNATNVTVLLPNGENVPQTRLVHNQFVGLVRYADGPALAPGIDVIVGDGFRGVRPVSQTFVRVNRPVSTCLDGKGKG
jgi:hypothetical protein